MDPSEPTISLATVNRWLSVLRTIARHPGLAPESLRSAVEADLGRRCGASTLYRDIAHLKRVGLLEAGRHRQGYYLVGPGASEEEMQMLLNGLRVQAEDLGSPLAHGLYKKLLQRDRRGRDGAPVLSHPVEAIASGPVVKTTQDAFQDVMTYLHEPIRRGNPVGLRLSRSPWREADAFVEFRVYPLQFVFHDMAWYLLADLLADGQFFVFRVDRLHPAIHMLDGPTRGNDRQFQRLQQAHQLLKMSWGMCFPPHDADGNFTGQLEEFQVRFSPEVAPFIQEHQQRHETQELSVQKDGSLIFIVQLPRDCSASYHFRRWLFSWGKPAEVLAPAWFRAQIAQEISEMAAYYTNG